MTGPPVRAAAASLAARLALLALLIMSPLVAAMISGALISRHELVEAAAHRALDLAQRGAEQQEAVLQEARTLLTVLARLPEITTQDPEGCYELLSHLIDDHPHMVEFALLDAQGRTVCTNRSVRSGISVLDKPYIQRLLAPGGHGFDTGEPSISRTSGIATVFMGLALPPAPGSDHPNGVLVVGLNLDWLASLAAKLTQNTDDMALLFHAPDGTILARHPANEVWVGRRVTKGPVMAAFNALSRQAGVTEGTGPDGVDRIYGFAPLPGTDGQAVLTIGLARNAALAAANQRMAIVLCVALAAMLIAAASGWFAARRFVIRPLGTLMHTARRLGAGDLTARALLDGRHAPELQMLAGTLNSMAVDFEASQAKLAESEAGYRLLAENASDMVARVGPDGVPRYLSPAAARLFGCPIETLLQASLVHRIHPDDQPAARAVQVRLLTATVDEQTICYRVQQPRGATVWIEAILRVVRDPATGISDGYISVGRDVTERRRIEVEREARAQEVQDANIQLERLARHLARARDRAELASRAKSRFLAGMSHELRTPLNGILGYTQLFRLEGGLTPTQTARVGAMLGAGAHLLQMINSVLDLSEIEADQITLNVEPVDTIALAAACLDLVRPMAEAKGLALQMSAAPDMPTHITSDATKLRQMLLNLLGNAVKFTSTGAVTLSLTPCDPASFRMAVTDTGPGVPADHRHRLFQDFERLHNAANEANEGAGLGLAITHRCAALMGGRVGYDDNPAGGSVFWLELPTETTMLENRAPASDREGAVIQSRRLRVLVVDDIAMNRDIAGSFLTAAGHEVAFADGGAAAIAAARNTDFDVILMDVRMPGIDGLEAARCIRRVPGTRGRVPIIALTAQAFADQVAECRQAGMTRHLSKPFAPDTLVDAVIRAAAENATPDAPPQAADAAYPIVDQTVFERTCSFLPADLMASYLQGINDRAQTLLHALRSPDSLAAPDKLADAAHALAGSIGMFGFERLSMAGRRFEHAVQVGAPDIATHARDLDHALQDSLDEVRNRMPTAA